MRGLSLTFREDGNLMGDAGILSQPFFPDSDEGGLLRVFCVLMAVCAAALDWKSLMKRCCKVIALGAIATAVSLYSLGCARSQASVDQATDRGRPAVAPVADVLATSGVEPGRKADLTKDVQATHVPLAERIAQAPAKTAQPYGVRGLKADELALVKRDLGSLGTLLEPHSFAFKLPGTGDVVLVASRHRGQAFEGQAMHRLVMRLRLPGGEYEPLVPAPSRIGVWNFSDLKTVVFEDVNGDGLGPDIVAIAEYNMGELLPEEDIAFPLAMVYLKQPQGLYVADLNLSEHLERSGAATIEQVREVVANSDEVLEGW